MQIPYELALGWRYTRAGRATRRNGFISFISGVSMLGIALGVAALIIVLSVMNGFQKEVRDRMLSVVAHIEIFAPGGEAMLDPDRTMAEARSNPQVIGAAPFVAAQALLSTWRGKACSTSSAWFTSRWLPTMLVQGRSNAQAAFPAMARRPDMSATSCAVGASKDRLEMAGAGPIVLRFLAGWFCSGFDPL